MAKATLQTLPYEVLVSIFDPLDLPSLVSLCLVCRVCNEAATPVLYRSVSWDLVKQGASWDTEDPPWLALKRLPWLRNHLQSLAICLDGDSTTQKRYDPNAASKWKQLYNRLLSRLTEEIQVLPSVQSLELVKRRWDPMDVFTIKARWFGELVQGLGVRIQAIGLPELPYYASDCFRFSFYPCSLTVRGSVGDYLHSPYFKSWAPRLRRVSLPNYSDFSGLSGLFTSLVCVRVGSCRQVGEFLESISPSRGLESLDMVITEYSLSSWAGAEHEEMDFPALKYIRVRIEGGYTDMDHGKKLLQCITSTSVTLLSVSVDADIPRRKCSASQSFAIWVSRRHGHTLRTLHLGCLPLHDSIHQVLSHCPQLKCIGFTQLWDQSDLSQLITLLCFSFSLKAICLTVGKRYSAHQVYAALKQRFPHIRHFLLRTAPGSAIEYQLWEGKWRIDSYSGAVSRVIQQVECSEKDWEAFISREQREFVDSLAL